MIKKINEKTCIDTNALEKHIKQEIIKIASERVGSLIDEMPREFLEKIKSLSNTIRKKSEKKILKLNSDDLESIEKIIQDETLLKQFVFHADKSLSRGDYIIEIGEISLEDKIKDRYDIKEESTKYFEIDNTENFNRIHPTNKSIVGLRLANIALNRNLISNSELLVNFFRSSPLSPLEFYQEITKSLLKQTNITITDFRLWQDNLSALIRSLYPEDLHNVFLLKQYDCLSTILLESDLILSSSSLQGGLFKQIQSSDIDHSDKLLLSVILFNLKEKYSFDTLEHEHIHKLNELFQNFLVENPEITFPELQSQDFKALQTMLEVKTNSCAIG